MDLPVTISEAALGDKVEVPTLDGKATLTIPAGTQSGTKLRMKGKGVPDPKGGTPGDMYVHTQIVVPKDTGCEGEEDLRGVEGNRDRPAGGEVLEGRNAIRKGDLK